LEDQMSRRDGIGHRRFCWTDPEKVLHIETPLGAVNVRVDGAELRVRIVAAQPDRQVVASVEGVERNVVSVRVVPRTGE
jgi:hypothetical protein